MNTTIEPMLGALIGGWELIMILLSLLVFLAVAASIIAIVIIFISKRVLQP